MKETLCWKCANATGGCAWSRELRFINGWTIMQGSVSIIVLDCPQFKKYYKQAKLISKRNIARLIKAPVREIFKYSIEKILRLTRAKQLNIYYDEDKKRFYQVSYDKKQ